jgi:hypothetical protein
MIFVLKSIELPRKIFEKKKLIRKEFGTKNTQKSQVRKMGSGDFVLPFLSSTKKSEKEDKKVRKKETFRKKKV